MNVTCIRPIPTLLVVAAICLISLQSNADDWATYQHDAAHTGRSSANFDPTLLQRIWGSSTWARPIVVGNSLYALRTGQGVSSIASFNLLTGQQNWSRANLDGSFASELTYAEGLLVLGVLSTSTSNSHPKLHVIDAVSGTYKYEVDLPNLESIPTTPAIARNSNNQLVAYTSSNLDTTAVNLGPSNGSVLWTRPGPSGFFSNPTIVGNSVIIAANDNHFVYDQLSGAYSLYPAGNERTVAYDSARMQYYVRDGSANILRAYSYTSNGVIAEKWQSSVSAANSVAIGADGTLYSSSGNGIFKIDPIDGHIIQSISGLQLSSSYTPVLSDNSLFIYGFTGSTEIFDLDTLNHVTSLPFGRDDANTPSKSPGVVFDGGYVVIKSGGFEVYFAIPEPSSALLAVRIFGLLAGRRSGR